MHIHTHTHTIHKRGIWNYPPGLICVHIHTHTHTHTHRGIWYCPPGRLYTYIHIHTYIHTHTHTHTIHNRGIWYYPPGRVLATIGWVPVEEYAFFILQTTATTLWFLAALERDTLQVCICLSCFLYTSDCSHYIVVSGNA